MTINRTIAIEPTQASTQIEFAKRSLPLVNQKALCKSCAYHRWIGCLALCVSLLAALVNSKGVLAHAALVRSEPTDGATLSAAPGECHLWFNEAIAARFSSVQILNAQGQPVGGLDLSAVQADPTALLVHLPHLPAGAYTLLWKTLSEADGHFSQGVLLFGVNVASPDAPTIRFTPARVPPIEVVLKWLNFASLAGLVGALAVLLLLYRPRLLNSHPQYVTYWQGVQQRIFHLAGWSALFALLIGMVLLTRQVWVLQQNALIDAGWRTMNWSVITQTRWGELWMARQELLLLLLSLLFVMRNGVSFLHTKPWLSGFVLILCLILLTVQALTGHAAGNPRNAWLSVPMATLHLSAASLWVGGLLSLVVGWWPWIVSPQENRLALLYMGFQPFGWLAVPCVGILIATGLYNSGQQVPSLDAFILTAYGWLLLGKIVLVLLVGSLGLLNAILLHPAFAGWVARWLGHPTDWRPVPAQRLPLLMLGEVVMGVLVLLLTGMLTASAPPRGMVFTVGSESQPATMTQTIDGLRVTLDVKPNRPGQNVLRVQTVGEVDPPPAEIIRVLLRFTYLDSDFGRVSAKMEKIAPDSYLLNSNDLKLAGPWQIDVVTRRYGIEDSVARFNWVVLPSGALPPTVLSKRSLAPPLTVASLTLLLLVGLGGLAMRWPSLLPAPLRGFAGTSKARFSQAIPARQVYELPAVSTHSLLSD